MCQIWTLPLKVCKEKYTFSIKLGDIKKKRVLYDTICFFFKYTIHLWRFKSIFIFVKA